MKKIQVYFQEVHNELINKTSWPTWAELQNSAIVVMVTSLIIAAVVYAMDISFDTMLKWFYNKLY
ncbi:MAG: preprotein translocase subunit SecE [Bacteroidales bacterium]|nr:preprotein translocase subunit SecE [Bacteroidales bacterium]